jgi:hypothetical protein
MAKPMFFYAGVYDNVADADADYEAIKSLHDGGAIGSYDSAVIVHRPDGKVQVTKTEKPTHKGAWVGLAAGAGVAVVFPFLLPAVSYAGMAGAGAGLGAWFGHLAHGTSRGEAKDIGAMLEPGKGRPDRDRHRQGRRADRARGDARRDAHAQARVRRLGRGRAGRPRGDRARAGRAGRLTAHSRTAPAVPRAGHSPASVLTRGRSSSCSPPFGASVVHAAAGTLLTTPIRTLVTAIRRARPRGSRSPPLSFGRGSNDDERFAKCQVWAEPDLARTRFLFQLRRFFTVREGRIAFQRGYWDRLSFLRLHGLPIPPA